MSLALVWTLVVLSSSPDARPLLVGPVPVGPVPADVQGKLSELTAEEVTGLLPATVNRGAQLADAAGARYFDLDFAGAVKNADAAIAEYDLHPESLGDGEAWVKAQVFAALSQQELGRTDRALFHLRAALAVRPQFRLSESEYPPEARALLERVRDQTADMSKVPLTVGSSPAFARVTLDGEGRGNTPLTVQRLPPGRHFVRVEKEGYLPSARWVEVSGPGAQLVVTLAPDPGEALAKTLREHVAKGSFDEALSAAKALAASKPHERTVQLLAVAKRPGDDGYVVTAAAVTKDGVASRSFVVVAADLTNAVGQLRALLSSLAIPNASPQWVGDRTAAAKAPSFDKALLGLLPPPPPQIVQAPPPPPPPIYKRGWFWAATASVVAVAAGGAAYAFTRPPPAPSNVALRIELPK